MLENDFEDHVRLQLPMVIYLVCAGCSGCSSCNAMEGTVIRRVYETESEGLESELEG